MARYEVSRDGLQDVLRALARGSDRYHPDYRAALDQVADAFGVVLPGAAAPAGDAARRAELYTACLWILMDMPPEQRAAAIQDAIEQTRRRRRGGTSPTVDA